MSNTAERACAFSTIACSSSSGASPAIRNVARIAVNPLRTPSSIPKHPRTSMSPSTLDSTSVRRILRAAAL